MMNIMSELKQLLKEKNKKYIRITNLLNQLYNKENQNLKDKKEIEYKIKFFCENINDLKILRDLFIENDKIKNEKEKEIEKEESKNDSDKSNLIIKPDEIIELKNSFNNINIFANEINNFIEKEIKRKYAPYNSFKQLIHAFINPNKFKENKYIPKNKIIITDKQRAEIHYTKICEIMGKNPINYEKLFGKLSNIDFNQLEEEQVDKLIEISLNTYYYFTEKQQIKIKDSFFSLIGDDEIADILYLDIKNIFLKFDKKNSKEKYIYENMLEHLSYSFDVIKNQGQKSKEDERQKKVSREEAIKILLSIYKNFLMSKNKENSYVYLNKNNIIEKIYYFLIINFISYEDEFEDGKNFYKFLYIKYLLDEKYNYKQLIRNKENIQKEIIYFYRRRFTKSRKIR